MSDPAAPPIAGRIVTAGGLGNASASAPPLTGREVTAATVDDDEYQYRREWRGFA